MSPSVIVIARSEQAAGLRKRLAADATVALFSDAESLKALNAVLAHPPRILALDRTFATTARGAALVRQVRADGRAGTTDIRVLSEDQDNQPLILSGRIASGESIVRTSYPLDYCGTRRALRFAVTDGVGLAVNGERGRLVNLSFAGAQVMVPLRVRPDEALRVMLVDGLAETRVRGVVAWSAAEPKGPAMIYRAGVEFVDPDTRSLEELCVRHGSAAHRTGE